MCRMTTFMIYITHISHTFKTIILSGLSVLYALYIKINSGSLVVLFMIYLSVLPAF